MDEDTRSIVPPISIAMTQFHIIMLHKNSFDVICLLNDKPVMTDRFNPRVRCVLICVVLCFMYLFNLCVLQHLMLVLHISFSFFFKKKNTQVGLMRGLAVDQSFEKTYAFTNRSVFQVKYLLVFVLIVLIDFLKNTVTLFFYHLRLNLKTKSAMFGVCISKRASLLLHCDTAE